MVTIYIYIIDSYALCDTSIDRKHIHAHTRHQSICVSLSRCVCAWQCILFLGWNTKEIAINKSLEIESMMYDARSIHDEIELYIYIYIYIYNLQYLIYLCNSNRSNGIRNIHNMEWVYRIPQHNSNAGVSVIKSLEQRGFGIPITNSAKPDMVLQLSLSLVTFGLESDSTIGQQL
jgi:hypothetical protein